MSDQSKSECLHCRLLATYDQWIVDMTAEKGEAPQLDEAAKCAGGFVAEVCASHPVGTAEREIIDQGVVSGFNTAMTLRAAARRGTAH